MATAMLGNWQVAHIGEAERHFLYAFAYLDATEAVCRTMVADEGSRTWPNASVVLMLASHSLELFLKGAIFSRKPNDDVGHHRIGTLFDRYRELFPEDQFNFQPLFRMEYAGFTEGEIELLKKREPVPSILYRYPVARPGVEWEGVLAFQAEPFLEILKMCRNDYQRIKDAI